MRKVGENAIAGPESVSEPALPIRAVIVTHEPDPESLGRLIESLKKQTYPIHITISDNGSRKVPVASLAKEWGVDYIGSRQNTGFGQAIHRVVLTAPERLILVLNWDIWLEPHAVEEAVRVYRSVPGIGAVSPKILWAPDPRFLDSAGTGLDTHMQAYNRGIGEPDIGQYDVIEFPLGACFAAVLLDRAAYLAIGGMDTRYFLYYEDIDYSIRLRRCGYQICTAPRAIAYHQHSADVSRFPDHFKHYFLKRNLVWTALKHLPASRIPEFFWFIVGVALQESRARKRYALNWLRIAGATLGHLPLILFMRWSTPGDQGWLRLMDKSPETFFDTAMRKPAHEEWAQAEARRKRFALNGDREDWLAYRRACARRARGLSMRFPAKVTPQKQEISAP
ncbi:MAG: glycosyltransferase family 2 protein [bacterium JZ-2024 1]